MSALSFDAPRAFRDWWRNHENVRGLALVEDPSVIEYLLEGDPDLAAFATRLRATNAMAFETLGISDRAEYTKTLWALDALVNGSGK